MLLTTHQQNATGAVVNDIVSTFDVTKEPLPDLLLKIQQGKIQIPDLQRSFCWSDERVVQLLASVSLGWTVGSILLLELGNSEASFRPRLVEGVNLKKPLVPTHLILDGQQRATTLYMSLFSNNPVSIRDKRATKNSDRWYYIDIEQALNPEVERENAIISLNSTRIKSGFSDGSTINCSTPEKEFQAGLFPISSVFHYFQWRKQYCKYWSYDAHKYLLL